MSNKEQIQNIIKSFHVDGTQLSSEFKLLAGDASSRIYYRYQTTGKESYIVTLYPDNASKASFDRFIYWQKKYQQAKIRVPAVFATDESKQIVVQEDVGNWCLQNELGLASVEVEKKWLLETVNILSSIRQLDTQDYCGQLPRFNFEKLNFEVNHTLKYFMSHYLGKSEEVASLQKLWEPLLNKIANLPMTISHRDYHSRNIMCFDSSAVVIDFQDSMLGPVQYDLCSLLDDCYIKYHPSSYQAAMREYFNLCVSQKSLSSSYEEFFVNYHLVKLQRQFKAIGSFCYVWSEKKNARYLKYISYVMESIKSSFAVLDQRELAPLKEKVLTLYYEH